MKSKAILLLFVPAAAFAAGTTYMEPVGFNRLKTDLGAALPTGSNVAVTHVEGTVGIDYMPDTNDTEFVGKTFRNLSASSSGASWHASEAGRYYYGRQTSMASNITAIDCREQNDWLLSGFLRAGSSTLEPLVETNLIQNHSWVASSSADTNMLRRLDYAIERDGFTCVVGMNNGAGNPVPALLPSGYNSISVGLSDGNHSYGMTPLDEPGRPKPEIVAPETACSWATPLVSSATAMLMETARTHSWTNALLPEAIKALLMAGATKGFFPSWDRTPSRPLDDIFGAGELNIYNSYNILIHGEQAPSPTSEVTTAGWDVNTSSTSAPPVYFFSVPTSNVMASLSVMLVWNRHITDGNPGPAYDPVPSLPNLDLRLYSATGFSLGTIVDLSTSVVCNLEHIFRLKLDPGQYALKVNADTNSRYALAWRGSVMAEPEFNGSSWTGAVQGLETVVSTGFAYIVQASTNIAVTNGWTSLQTNLVLQSPFSWTDSASTNMPTRFYRIIPVP